MTFHPSLTARERILAIGSFGVGKSTAWLKTADRLQKTAIESGEPVPQFHVLDTEYTEAALRSLEAGYPHLTNVHVYRTWEWRDYTANMKKIYAQNPTVDDWLIVDNNSQPWKEVQEYFLDEVFGKEPEEFWLTARQENKKGNALDGRKDWGTINKIYFGWTAKMFRFPGHIYATAMAEPLSRESDSKQMVDMFGPHGIKPTGQKLLAFPFHTVLWMKCPRAGEYKLTTVKDRERKDLVDEPLTDFSTGYLMKVARWRP